MFHDPRRGIAAVLHVGEILFLVLLVQEYLAADRTCKSFLEPLHQSFHPEDVTGDVVTFYTRTPGSAHHELPVLIV